MTVEFRTATAEDSEFVFQVKKAAFKAYVDQVYGWDEETQKRLHKERFLREDFSIVHLNGQDVGYMALAEDAEGIDLHQIFLLPEYQSKGIGQACLTSLFAKNKPIRLRVLKVNPRARAFYERLGFTQVGESETHYNLRWQ